MSSPQRARGRVLARDSRPCIWCSVTEAPWGAPALPSSALTGTFTPHSVHFTHCAWHDIPYSCPLNLLYCCEMKSIQLLCTAVLQGIRNGQDTRKTSSVMLTWQSGGQISVWHLAPKLSNCWHSFTILRQVFLVNTFQEVVDNKLRWELLPMYWAFLIFKK